jgi:hypothetical protein
MAITGAKVGIKNETYKDFEQKELKRAKMGCPKKQKSIRNSHHRGYCGCYRERC